MGLASALSTALTGLTAAETTIDVVGNNVANSNTAGFKASKAVFATQFLQTRSVGSAPTMYNGGTNPNQIGLGTRVAEITQDFTTGTIDLSSNPSDLAIQGDGFFIVQGSQGEILYTRNGMFKINSQNELVTINGQRLLGYGVDENYNVVSTQLTPLTIPLGAAAVAQATRNVFLEGSFTPTGDLATQGRVIQSQVLIDGSKEVPPNLAPTDIFAVNGPDAAAMTANFGAAPGGIDAGTYQYRVVAYDAFGHESPPSNVIGPLTSDGTPAQSSFELGNLPPLTGDFVGHRIYRTNASGTGEYFLVADAGAAASYVDTVANGSLGPPLDESTLVPSNYSYYVTFYNSASGLESIPTAMIGPQAVTVTGRRIELNNIPQPTSGDFDGVKIYRNLSNNDNTFYEIATLLGGETSYIDGASDASIIDPDKLIDLDGPRVSFGLQLTDVVLRDGSTYYRPFEEGALSFTGRKGGRSLDTQGLNITAATTVQDLINFMEQALGIVETVQDANFPILGTPGGSLTADGRLELSSNWGADNGVGIGLSSLQFTNQAGVTDNVNLGFSTTQEAIGETAVTDFIVYDSLGIPLNVRVTVVLEQRNSTSTVYRWYADSPDNQPLTGSSISVGTGTVTFDGEGNLINTSNNTVSIQRRQIASSSPLEFELDFSQVSGLAAHQASVAASRQDGSASGALASYLIGEDGVIRGVFTNGVTRDLGQLQLARFANNNGLEQRGENLYAAGVNSGLPVRGNPGEQGIGTVKSGAIELSNTDIGRNLIDLILASTMYRGNSRVITTTQQMFDELMNLRR